METTSDGWNEEEGSMLDMRRSAVKALCAVMVILAAVADFSNHSQNEVGGGSNRRVALSHHKAQAVNGDL